MFGRLQPSLRAAQGLGRNLGTLPVGSLQEVGPGDRMEYNSARNGMSICRRHVPVGSCVWGSAPSGARRKEDAYKQKGAPSPKVGTRGSDLDDQSFVWL